MRHDEIMDRLVDLVGIHPTRPDEHALQEHVAQCAECRDRLDTLRAIDAELARTRGDGPSDALGQRVLAIPANHAGEDPTPIRPRDRRLAFARWLPAAAASVIAVLVGAFTLALTRDTAPPPAFVADHAISLVGDTQAIHASLAMGRASGSNQPIRLEASGLSATEAPYYTLWLIDGEHHMMAATFRPEDDGSCVVMGVVPQDIVWTKAAITMGDEPPTDDSMVAVGSF